MEEASLILHKATLVWGTSSLLSLFYDRNLLTNTTPPEGPVSKTPAVAGQILVKGDSNGAVMPIIAKLYWLATATCMFMMQWS